MINKLILKIRTKRKRNQKGVALLLAMFSLALMSYLAMEVQYETQVEYLVNNTGVSKLKAYYAARSGIELSLLRIKIYQNAKATLAAAGPAAAQYDGLLNMIWSFPFSWPPMVPDEMNAVGKDSINKVVKEAKLDAGYFTTIIDEGTKIDINDLDSPSKTIREATKTQLLQIFETEEKNETEFQKNNPDFKSKDLVDNLIDWVDSDKEAKRGGNESQFYETPSEISYPPNRQFRTIDELRLVAGMSRDAFELLSQRVTIYGAKAINPNTASSEVLQSIDVSITSEIATEVIKKRQDLQAGGPFKSADEFWGFIQGKGARLSQEKIAATPIFVGSTFNFRIRSVGSFGNSNHEIEAVVFDLNQSAKAVAEAIKKETPPPITPGGTPAVAQPAPTSAQAAQSATKGPPRIVYWSEK